MLLKKIKIALGILFKRALTGPIEVSLDLTCRCTTGCLMCWYWSPLLDKCPSKEWANQQIDFGVLKKLVGEFKKLDVKKVIFGGQGDPLLYPRILEAIGLVKKHGMETSLITGGVYLSNEKTRAIFDLGLDHLDISLQAASPEAYTRIHPSQKDDTFVSIKEQLMFLSELKRKSGEKAPHVRIIHVVCNLNYLETLKVVESAKEIGAQSIGFKRLDVIPQTRSLLLNEYQLKDFEAQLDQAEKKAKELGIMVEIDDFRRYMLKGLATGIYTDEFYAKIPCYAGWYSSRILANGDVVPCCGCYGLIFGNVNNSNFTKIWNSKEYQDFRKRALKTNKDSLVENGCKCYSCIDFRSNLGIYRRLHPFKAKGF